MKLKLSFLFLIILLGGWCNLFAQKSPDKTTFQFAFLTDIHLSDHPNNCFEGLQKAMDSSIAQGAEFIITGGDNANIDVLGKDAETAKKLVDREAEAFSKSKIPIYPIMGNHDRFFGCENSDPQYNKGLFESKFGKSYRSFDHKGWHFILLNTVQGGEKFPCVEAEQLAWIEKDLAGVKADMPIVVAVHVPFLSVYSPVVNGKCDNSGTFSNFKQVWDLFKGKNLKLVLQGHQHIYEEIKVMGIQFITAGAVCGSWWGGPYNETEEGYLMVTVKGNDCDWKYVDYGWEPKK